MLTLDKVYQASQVLREVIRETDMILAPNIHPGTNVYLKTENLQVTGSFKIRGSYYKISKLTDEEKAQMFVDIMPEPSAMAPRCAWSRACMMTLTKKRWS